jgi:flagellar protein FliO/FliZ
MTKTIARTAHLILRIIPFVALFLVMVANDARAEEMKSITAAAPPTTAQIVAPVAVEKVHAFRDGDTFTAELQTTSGWSGSDVQVQYFRDSIQVDITGAFLNKGKQLIKVEDRAFKSVYATQFDATTVRARLTVKPGLSAKSFAGHFHAKRGPGAMTFEITGDANDGKSIKAVSDEPHTIAVADEDTIADSMPATLIAGASTAIDAVGGSGASVKGNDSKNSESKIANSKALDSKPAESKEAGIATASIIGDAKSDTAAVIKKVDTNKLPENEIPVLSATKAEKKSESNPFFRIITTLIVIAVALGASAYGLKKMAARTNGKKGLSTKINVLTTHHLGPKKNLMIIQVAGETLLIGVTDHNISMLKTLALIDDELPASVPQRFDQTMEDFVDDGDDGQEEPIVMRGLDQIRDTVSTRLKNMRNL